MSKWIKIAETIDGEFYHGTTVGIDNSILNNILKNGLDPKIAQGRGQGSGFYVYDNEEAAKRQSFLISGKTELNSFGQTGYSATPSGSYPMVIRLPVDFNSDIFDVDTESLPSLCARIFFNLFDLIKQIPDGSISYRPFDDPETTTEILTSKIQKKQFGENIGVKLVYKDSRLGESFRIITTMNTSLDIDIAELVGKLIDYLKKNFPSEFKVEENKVFERIKNRPNKNIPIALKYNGKYNIHIDPTTDIQVYFDDNWISGSEYLKKIQTDSQKPSNNVVEKPELMPSARAIRKIRY